MQRQIDVSIVLTSVNEEKLLKLAVHEIQRSLAGTVFTPKFILVDDGGSAESKKILQQLTRSLGRGHQCLFHKGNQGRGQSVADGIRAAKTEIVGFIDPDLEIPARYIFPFVQAIQKGADVAGAVRYYDVRPEDVHRILLSKGYAWLMRLVLDSRLKDTEAGLKFFRKSSILPILDTTIDKRWFWDTEVMVRSARAGLRIVESPTVVIKRDDVQTTVNLFGDTLYYLWRLWKFRQEIHQ